MNSVRFFLISLALSSNFIAFSQFSRADSLKGAYGATRDWWDLTHYNLSVSFDINKKEISGSNEMSFKKIKDGKDLKMQIDLQAPMILDSVVSGGKKLAFFREDNAYFFYPKLTSSSIQKIKFYFHGAPKVAQKAPWDGGIVWGSSKNYAVKQNMPWISVACQGIGASVWIPCKDSQQDEADSVTTTYTAPSNLKCIGNGRFVCEKTVNNLTSTTWRVSNPINSYNIIPYIGDYVKIHDTYKGLKGNLDLDYWVIKGNEGRAKEQFKEVPRMLAAFEHWFGPYPFYEDSYKLIESPYLGMEHQSGIAYGNGYQNGYQGTDLSETGEGLNFDFIIVHESGHEWFGNSITTKDVADMWVHEAFTNYSETLFLDYHFGTAKANTYCRGLRNRIENDKPIIGKYGVCNEGSGDMYYKGSNMIHTIRTLLGNDEMFRKMLMELNKTFYHKTVTTKEIETFMSTQLNMDLSKIFDQYLRQQYPPTLEIIVSKGKMKYRWINCIEDFDMPIMIEKVKYDCSTKWSKWIEGHTTEEFNKNLYYLIKE